MVAGLLFLGTLYMPALRATDFPEFEKLPAQPNLPDPLVMQSGEKITTKEQWIEKRRPELKALFEHYMYGQAPAAPDKAEATIEREDKAYFGGKATKLEIALK